MITKERFDQIEASWAAGQFSTNNFIELLAAAREGVELKASMQAVKLVAVSATDAQKGFSRIIRLCIDAGITEQLPELEENQKAVELSRIRTHPV